MEAARRRLRTRPDRVCGGHDEHEGTSVRTSTGKGTTQPPSGSVKRRSPSTPVVRFFTVGRRDVNVRRPYRQLPDGDAGGTVRLRDRGAPMTDKSVFTDEEWHAVTEAPL